MTRDQTLPAASFTAKERDLVRHAFGQFFGTFPSVADGILLRTWRAGERAGQPKIPPAMQGMIDRGLVEIRPMRHRFRAFFTAAGTEELRLLVLDRRAIDPVRFRHLRQELGIEPDRPVPAENPPS